MANKPKINVIQAMTGGADQAAAAPSIEPEAPKVERKRNNTITVYLDDDTAHALDLIAIEAKQTTKAGLPNRHGIIQLAIKKLLQDYEKGYRPSFTFSGKIKP